VIVRLLLSESPITEQKREHVGSVLLKGPVVRENRDLSLTSYVSRRFRSQQ